MILRMKAIIEKEYVVNKIIGDIKCGDRSLQDCIGIDGNTLVVRFLSIPIYKRTNVFNEHQASQGQNHTSKK